jgi:hypothetical protein
MANTRVIRAVLTTTALGALLSLAPREAFAQG